MFRYLYLFIGALLGSGFTALLVEPNLFRFPKYNQNGVLAAVEITGIINGNIMEGTIAINNREYKTQFRLACIKTLPLANQPWGILARDYVYYRITNTDDLDVEFLGKDKAGRLLVFVYIENVPIGLDMVQNGYAYADEDNYKDCPAYKQDIESAEDRAKENKIGLWSDKKLHGLEN